MSLQVNSWESAIRKAKLKIQELKLAIETFEAMRESGQPFIPTQTQSKGRKGRQQHSV
jgi:hypothetical protein